MKALGWARQMSHSINLNAVFHLFFFHFVSFWLIGKSWFLFIRSTSKHVFINKLLHKYVNEKVLVWFQYLKLKLNIKLQRAQFEISQFIIEYFTDYWYHIMFIIMTHLSKKKKSNFSFIIIWWIKNSLNLLRRMFPTQ